MKSFLSTVLIVFAAAVVGQGQVLKASVSVQYGHLPTEEQNTLSNLAEKIEQYFNGYEWVDDEFEYDVDCNIQVIVETVQKKTAEKIYKTQFLISSISGENFYDKSWEFPYQPSFPLSHSKAQFDPVTHFLDFYAYMVLAGEMDTNGLLLGTPFYDKAMDIASQAKLSKYSRGWNYRIQEVQNLTDMRTRPLRELKPDFFEALYFLDQDKPLDAYKDGLLVLKGLKKVYKMLPNSKPLQTFFKSHHKELAKIFSGHNPELEQLVTLDSKHRETYRAVIE